MPEGVVGSGLIQNIFKSVRLLAFLMPVSGTFAGFIPYTFEAPLQWSDLEGIDYNSMKLPIFWGQELIGADLAAEIPAPSRAKVIVLDAPTRRLDVATFPTEPRKVHMVRKYVPRLTLKTGVGILFQKAFPQHGAIAQALLTDYKEVEFPDPREKVGFDNSNEIHGLHVSGLIGSPNAPFSVSRSAALSSVDVFSGPAYTFNEDYLRTLENVRDNADHGSIVSMSLRVTSLTNDVLTEAYRSLMSKKDLLLVIASGNGDGTPEGIDFPADDVLNRLPAAVVVGSFSPTGILSNFSNRGRGLQIVAPGEEIFSWGSDLKISGSMVSKESGTSMATPIVSGTLANIRSFLPDAPSEVLREILYSTAWDLGKPGHDDIFGHGLLNTYKATVIASMLSVSPGMTAETIRNGIQNMAELTLLMNRHFVDQYHLPLMSNEFIKERRKALMLQGNPSAFQQISKLYEPRFPKYAQSLRLIDYNRGDRVLSPHELQEALQTLISSHLMQLKAQILKRFSLYSVSLNPSFMRSLAQPQMILEIAKGMPLSPTMEFTLRSRLMDVNPALIGEYECLLSEKKKKHGVPDLNVALKTGEGFDRDMSPPLTQDTMSVYEEKIALKLEH